MCGFSIVTDALFANFKRNVSRKSSLAQALKDVETLPLSPLPVAVIDELDEDDHRQSSSSVEARRLQFRSLREDSIDSSNSSKSAASRNSQTDSLLSHKTSAPQENDSSNCSSNENAEHRTDVNAEASAPLKACDKRTGIPHSQSEKIFSTRVHDRPLQRVQTEPVDLSKKSKEKFLNGKVKSSIELNEDDKDLKSFVSRSSRDSKCMGGEEDSVYSFNCSDGEFENGLSDDSCSSSLSSARKKKKKGAFRKLFHRKHKPDS